jgi:hypothetical protein
MMHILLKNEEDVVWFNVNYDIIPTGTTVTYPSDKIIRVG